MSSLSRSIMKYESNPMGRTAQTSSNRVALLLAGGDGTRLRDLTRAISGAPIPKQYCRLLRGSSLLEAAISRAHLFAPCDRISVIINADHIDLAKDQVNTLSESNIFVQPLNRDTGPGMIYALLQLKQAYPDATVAVFPTDHYVDNDWAFIGHVLHAVDIVSHMPEKIAILGIAPDRPETGYGYILPAKPLKMHRKAYHVEAFIEKPNLTAAQAIIEEGGLWNTFVMVFKIGRMLELLRKMVPYEYEQLSELRASPSEAAAIYQSLRSWNLSTRVLSRIPEHLIVHRVANVRWSDWGTRESVERTYKALKLVPFWNQSNSIENQWTR